MASPIPKFQTLITVNCEVFEQISIHCIFFKVEEFRKLVQTHFESIVDLFPFSGNTIFL
jgi:hypothetical protein